MPDRDKLPLKTNIVTDGQLVFDTPKIGDGPHGEYHLYCVNVDGTEYSWFASEQTHEMIQKMGLGKGPITILREEYEGGEHPRFRINGKIYDDVFPKEEPGPEYFEPPKDAPSGTAEILAVIDRMAGDLKFVKGYFELKPQESAKPANTLPPNDSDIPF